MHLPVNAMIPVEIAGIILPFAGLFTKPVWNHVQILLVGAILTTGQPKRLISPETDLESPFDPSAPPFWEIVAESAAKIPDEVWATIPEDASEQVDRYLYQS